MAILLGNQANSGATDFFNVGNTGAWAFVPTANGDVARIWCSFGTANPTLSAVKLGIYANSGSLPGTLLGSATVSPVPVGGGRFFADLTPAITVATSTTYWLAVSGVGEQVDFIGTALAGREGTGAMVTPWNDQSNMINVPPLWGEEAGTPHGPYFFGAGAGNVVTSGTTITPVLPASTAANDIAVAVLMTNAGDTFLAESGWTTLGTNIDNNANMSMAAYWRRIGASEPNPTFDITANTALSTTNGLYARVYVFRDCITTGTPMEAVGNTGTPTSSTTPATSAMTTTGANRLAVSIVGVDDDPVFSSGNPPAGWTVPTTAYSTTTGGDAMIAIIAKDVPSATTESAVTIGTLPAADFWRAVSFALIPVPSGPTFSDAPVDFRRTPRRRSNERT